METFLGQPMPAVSLKGEGRVSHADKPRDIFPKETLSGTELKKLDLCEQSKGRHTVSVKGRRVHSSGSGPYRASLYCCKVKATVSNWAGQCSKTVLFPSQVVGASGPRAILCQPLEKGISCAQGRMSMQTEKGEGLSWRQNSFDRSGSLGL